MSDHLETRLEARRLTGPHLLDDRTGAALDVPLDAGDSGLSAQWERQARVLLDAVGWSDEITTVRRLAGGATLFVSAPADALYAATDLAEEAWSATVEAREPRADWLRDRIARERNPAILALAAAAERRGLTFLHDDAGVSVGSGRGVRLWPLDALPSADAVDWAAIHDIPIAVVTGSNGKTTAVRLIAAMAREAGHVAGYTSTDGVVVGDKLVEASDYAGPMGARLVLRDSRVTLAILETARGGILRRGLAVRRADVAVITNIAEDHFGDFGVASLEDLADAKLVVARVVRGDGSLVLNADDATLAARGAPLGRAVTWFSLDARHPLLRASLAGRDAIAVALEGESLVILRESQRETILSAADIPASMGGAARYVTANALAAAAAALALRDKGVQVISLDAVRRALRTFRSGTGDNSGRGNLLELGGLRVIVDYAHNPHGIAALTQLVDAVPAGRLLVVLGQAGDRDDDAIRGLAQAVWTLGADRIIVKELASLRRGRAPGVVRSLLAGEFRRLGARGDELEEVESELDAVRAALRWGREGDLLLLLIHEDRDNVLALLEKLAARGWTPGKPLD